MSDPFFLVEVMPAAGRFMLDGPEGRHAAAVRRMQVGESLVITDGFGARADAVVDAVTRDAVELVVGSVIHEPAQQPRLVVVQGLPKGDRGELAVQMMTEVGVDEIVPWQASRCVTRWQGDRGQKSLQRWRSTAREAGKQSRRAWLPEVADVASTAEVVRRFGGALVLHEEATDPLSTMDFRGDVVLVVGPEGGISPDEVAAFEAAGARTVRLGPTVLRTSTAGVAAAAVVNARTGRWS